ATFTFIEDVLTEVMAIFPSEYIHIGGNEVDTTAWATCDKCLKRMKQIGVDSVGALQGYAVGRIASFLRANGRRLIGWDGVTKGDAPAGATVMSGHGRAVQAANDGHEVVMAPHSYLNFN